MLRLPSLMRYGRLCVPWKHSSSLASLGLADNTLTVPPFQHTCGAQPSQATQTHILTVKKTCICQGK